MCVCSNGQAKGPREAKVSKLERIALPVYQQILWLQVPMQNPAWGKHTAKVLTCLGVGPIKLLGLGSFEQVRWQPSACGSHFASLPAHEPHRGDISRNRSRVKTYMAKVGVAMVRMGQV